MEPRQLAVGDVVQFNPAGVGHRDERLSMSDSKYEFTDDMVEISGFGGAYEDTCRAMVRAGCEWWDAHPGADPQFHGFRGLYGLLMEDNQDAQDLSAAMLAAANHDATGAMHQATAGHVLHIHRVGWAQYVEESRQRRRDEDSAANAALQKG